MLKKIIFLFCFLLLLSNVFSDPVDFVISEGSLVTRIVTSTLPVPSNAQLMGVPPEYYTATETQTMNGKQVTFTLNPGEVYFYSLVLNVSDEGVDDKNYFLVIPEGTELMPCDLSSPHTDWCVFISPDGPYKELFISEHISTVYLDGGKIDLRNNHVNSFDLVILGSLYVPFSGEIIASGKPGFEGSKDTTDCSSTDGFNAGNSSNIEVRETVFVDHTATLIIDAGGARGGNGVNGFVAGSHGDEYNQSTYCERLDGTNGGNAGLPGKITLNKLILLDESEITFITTGGSAGEGGVGISYTATQNGETILHSGSDGRMGLASSAGEIMIKNSAVSGTPNIVFKSFKGIGRNSNDLIDGIVTIKGCNLSGLNLVQCNAGRINIFSDDALDLLDSLNEVCVKPRTQVQPRLNCDCYESTAQATETELIFSLTGTAKTFQGQALSGSLNDFFLGPAPTSFENPSQGDVSTQTWNAPGPHSFSNGFFNFSFGKDQPLFSDLVLSFGVFSYLLNFGITTSIPEEFIDSANAGFRLTSFEQEGCG